MKQLLTTKTNKDMKTSFQFKIENISKGDVKLNGADISISSEISAEEITSVGGFYGKLMEAVATVAATIQRLENGEPLIQQQDKKNEETIPSDGAPLTKFEKEACKKAIKKTIKGEKKRGRKAAAKEALDKLLLKKDDVDEDAQAEAGWDTL